MCYHVPMPVWRHNPGAYVKMKLRRGAAVGAVWLSMWPGAVLAQSTYFPAPGVSAFWRWVCVLKPIRDPMAPVC